MLSQLVLWAIAAQTVFAQENGETGPDNSTTPTALDGEIIVHIIQVGKEMNEFTPNSILANVGMCIFDLTNAGKQLTNGLGDKVMFEFCECILDGRLYAISSLRSKPEQRMRDVVWCIANESLSQTREIIP